MRVAWSVTSSIVVAECVERLAAIVRQRSRRRPAFLELVQSVERPRSASCAGGAALQIICTSSGCDRDAGVGDGAAPGSVDEFVVLDGERTQWARPCSVPLKPSFTVHARDLDHAVAAATIAAFVDMQSIRGRRIDGRSGRYLRR